VQSDYAALARALDDSLHLRQASVAVSFTDSIPDGIRERTGRVPAGCRFWQDASQSTFATSAAHHEMCAIGVYTHNLRPSEEQQKDLLDSLTIFDQLGYVRKEDLPLIPLLPSRSKFVVYGPLADTRSRPDVVLLFVSASQTLILSEATQQVENNYPPAMGRPACAVIPQVMNTRRAAFSAGCCGARAYLDVLTEDVALFALPGVKIEAYVQRIETLAGANTVLSKFHDLRRRDIEAGQRPTIQDSLAALKG
jgi:uncharacterized protein (DUF169 family)